MPEGDRKQVRPIWYAVAVDVLPVFLGFAALAVVVRLVAGSWDHRRIRDEIAGRGGQVREIVWSPMGPGWFGDKSSRIYRVTYVDRAGRARSAFCKTSLSGGVYFTQEDVDEVGEVREGRRVQGSLHDGASRGVEGEAGSAPMETAGRDAEFPWRDEDAEAAALREEVERLRAENEALKRRMGG